MRTNYATHAAYTNAAPNHMQAIVGMTTAAEIADENKLGDAYRVSERVHLLLRMKDGQLPETSQELQEWLDDTQHRLGLALGHYGLAISNIINIGDGNKEDWERKYNERMEEFNKTKAVAPLASPEEKAQKDFEELRSSKKVLVNIITQDRHDHTDRDNHLDHGATTARERLEKFVSELEKQRQAPDSPPLLRGPAEIAEERRLGSYLNQSLKLFDDVRLAEAGDHRLHPVNSALTLEMKLLEDGLDNKWKADVKGYEDYSAERKEEFTNDIKYHLGQDLGKYGLVPVTGIFDKETKKFTFTAVEKERYNGFLNDEGKIDPGKAFGDERPSPETLEKVEKYIDDFAQARQLSLGEVAARGL